MFVEAVGVHGVSSCVHAFVSTIVHVVVHAVVCACVFIS